jgi:hypothetical protein
LRAFERGPAGVDFGRAWWTPPLAPAAALRLERAQIAGLGLRPMVSLTDHDDIEAGLSLGVANSPAEVPLAVEWTAPYERSWFHVGVHNIPRKAARGWMAAMADYTARPGEDRLLAILREFRRAPETLIVLNHPFWLEEGVEEDLHRRALLRLLRACAGWFDALELNGTRPWKENAETIQLAREYARPLVSGGDRHACEPGASINLTNANSFGEFVAEIRAARGTILFLPQYREPLAQRLLEACRDILRAYPEYPGRERWSDRIFYCGADGVERPLAQIWGGREPRWLAAAAAAVQFVAAAGFRPAWRLLLSERGEARP